MCLSVIRVPRPLPSAFFGALVDWVGLLSSDDNCAVPALNLDVGGVIEPALRLCEILGLVEAEDLEDVLVVVPP